MSTTSHQTMSETGGGRLQLADWRRRVGELYAEVRDLAARDPAAAHARWRTAREALYRDHPSSPLPVERRTEFRAVHFPYDSSLRFEVQVKRDEPPASGATPACAAGVGGLGLKLPISTGRPLGFERVGRLEIPFAAGARWLALFWLPEYAGGLFLPFRDATNGRETYGGGRYLLDTGKGADLGGDPDRGAVVVDFNFAYQPSCAFDPRWSCPLSPAENRLDIEIHAGERLT
ncbi:MAG: DUF1684 domain-containing protein [Candidatus Limnocylindrales bacterium]